MTLRQLFWAVEGRRKELWNHTSHILAEIRNDMTIGKKVRAGDLNPFARKQPEKLPRMSDVRLNALEDGVPVYTVQ